MTEQTWPSMTGWRKRERIAKERAEHKRRMADVREARRLNRMREEGYDVEQEAPAVAPEKPREGDSATVPPEYPNPDDMDRDALFAYLKAHGENPGPASKDETLRAKVREVRDGDTE